MGNFNKTKKCHFIYKTTCLINGKYYIGMHSTNNINDGYMGSGKRLRYSIRKYGDENFKVEILEFLETRELLVEKEREIVNSELLSDTNCMNLQEGGISGFDYINKLRFLDPEYDKKWKLLQSDKMKRCHKSGKIKTGKDVYDWTGKSHSDETKNKMSETSKGMGKGKTNSQYGTCWVTNGKEAKKIKKEDLEGYLIDGWFRGRKVI